MWISCLSLTAGKDDDELLLEEVFNLVDLLPLSDSPNLVPLKVDAEQSVLRSHCESISVNRGRRESVLDDRNSVVHHFLATVHCPVWQFVLL